MRYRINPILLKIITLSMFILILGCSKDEEPRLSIPVEVSFKLDAESSTIGTKILEEYSNPNFILAWLSQNNMTVDQVTSIVAGKGQIIPLSGNIQYSFFNDIIINVGSTSNIDQTIEEMYYNDFVDFDHTGNLELFSSISELKDIMIAGIFDLQLKFNLRQGLPTSSEHLLKFDLLIYD